MTQAEKPLPSFGTPEIAADLDREEYARVLKSSDCEAFRAIRLEALERIPRVFAASYEEEKNYTLAEWQQRCTETNDRCVIGIFNSGGLIGMTAAMKWDEDPTGKAVLFRSSYIKPEHRRHGLSALLCESRIEWARQRLHFDTGLFFHREGHWIAGLVTSLGAKYWKTVPMQWANGETANGLWYRYDLWPGASGFTDPRLTRDENEAPESVLSDAVVTRRKS